MEDNSKIQVHVPEGYNGSPIEVIVREGVAPKINEPIAFGRKKVTIGTMFALVAGGVFNATPKENKGILLYNLQPDGLGLEFIADPNDALAPILHGNLELNPDLVAFGINKDRYFSGRDLIKFARKFAHCFADPGQPTKLIASLQNFEVKFEQVHKKEDDRKGNASEQIKSALKFTRGEVPLAWDLKLPLFKGTPDVEFTVEIEIEAEGGHPAFAFYSLEVELLLRKLGPDLITTEVNKFAKQFKTLEVVS